MLPTPDPAGGDEARAAIDVLVTVTLDDLDEGHLSVETALRTIATAAWKAGRAEALAS
ncbi:hypothetical protein [Pseudonocardia sp. KRD291]|uniref:hypothetical protein n=1 Tax=Pseudonocardia sp. KRD291 TaxID=2792007 RepID=UPI001C49F56B|nr:hypothetical protein [Pseudonocardia sp. KRD291]MBW0102276.1 hypothetical protein [Pseudonocardia sp. KRD291]